MFLHEVKLQECVTDPSTQLAKVFVRTDGHRATSELNTQNQKNEHSARPERSSRLRNRVRVQRTQQQLCLHKQLAIRFNTKKTGVGRWSSKSEKAQGEIPMPYYHENKKHSIDWKKDICNTHPIKYVYL